MEIKNEFQASVYKDMMDLQKMLANDILQMLPNQNMQTNNTTQMQQVQKQTPPPNPNGTISKYA